MTTETRDPQTPLYCTTCSRSFAEYDTGISMNDGRPEPCCPYCGGDRFSAKDYQEHWAASLTPEGRADLRAACVAIRRLIDHEDQVELWRAATDTLRDLNEYTDRFGETS